MERITSIQAELQADLGKVTSKGQRDVDGLRAQLGMVSSQLERLRDDTSAGASRAGSSVSEQLAESTVREEVRRQLVAERGTLLVPKQDDSIRKEVFAALETEGQLRKASEERVMLDMKSMIKEEKQERVRDIAVLRDRVEAAEQSIFVDSGTREERDRDLKLAMKTLEEDLNHVKVQLQPYQRPLSVSGSVASGGGGGGGRRPGSTSGSVVSSRQGSVTGSAARLVHLVNP